MLLRLYNKNNNPKDLEEVIRILEEGGLIIYPTDTMYAIGCHGGHRAQYDGGGNDFCSGTVETGSRTGY